MEAPIVPISWGELIDKVTILEIKRELLEDSSAVFNVNRELQLLMLQCSAALLESVRLASLKDELSAINRSLWAIEDTIRDKERVQEFDEGFIQLARSVYRENDRRAEVKRRINQLMKSELVEEKSYKAY